MLPLLGLYTLRAQVTGPTAFLLEEVSSFSITAWPPAKPKKDFI